MKKWDKEKRRKYNREYYHKQYNKYSHSSILILEFIQRYYHDYDILIDYEQAEKLMKNNE